MQKIPLLTATNALILICVLAYAAIEGLFNNTQLGFELYYFENSKFQLHQLITHMFLHGSPTHLFFNMFGLWMFGNTLEKFWGVRKFIIFYILCGLGAATFYMTVNYINLNISSVSIIESQSIIYGSVVGASGALYGVLVAFAFMFPNNKIMLIFLPVPIAAKFFVPALLALDIFSEFTGFSIFGQNIAHAAHVGGAVTAAILMFVWIKRKPKKTTPTMWK